jgi:hypothetical protein
MSTNPSIQIDKLNVVELQLIAIAIFGEKVLKFLAIQTCFEKIVDDKDDWIPYR